MYELRVLNGLHLGASLPMSGNHWVIGNADECDLSLKDLGLEACHCTISRSGDDWLFKANQGSASYLNGHPVKQNLDLGKTFLVNGIGLVIVLAGTPWTAAIPMPIESRVKSAAESTPSAIIGSVSEDNNADFLERGIGGREVQNRRHHLMRRVSFVAGIAVSIIGTSWGLSSSPQLGAGKSVSPADIHITGDADAGVNFNHHVPELQRLIDERMLSNNVKVSVGDHRISLSGELSPEDYALYHRMLERYRATTKQPTLLDDNVRLVNDFNRFDVIQVLTGTHAHIVLKDGTRMFIGDERNGVSLQDIDAKHIIFQGDQRFEVSW